MSSTTLAASQLTWLLLMLVLMLHVHVLQSSEEFSGYLTANSSSAFEKVWQSYTSDKGFCFAENPSKPTKSYGDNEFIVTPSSKPLWLAFRLKKLEFLDIVKVLPSRNTGNSKNSEVSIYTSEAAVDFGHEQCRSTRIQALYDKKSRLRHGPDVLNHCGTRTSWDWRYNMDFFCSCLARTVITFLGPGSSLSEYFLVLINKNNVDTSLANDGRLKEFVSISQADIWQSSAATFDKVSCLAKQSESTDFITDVTTPVGNHHWFAFHLRPGTLILTIVIAFSPSVTIQKTRVEVWTAREQVDFGPDHCNTKTFADKFVTAGQNGFEMCGVFTDKSEVSCNSLVGTVLVRTPYVPHEGKIGIEDAIWFTPWRGHYGVKIAQSSVAGSWQSNSDAAYGCFSKKTRNYDPFPLWIAGDSGTKVFAVQLLQPVFVIFVALAKSGSNPLATEVWVSLLDVNFKFDSCHGGSEMASFDPSAAGLQQCDGMSKLRRQRGSWFHLFCNKWVKTLLLRQQEQLMRIEDLMLITRPLADVKVRRSRVTSWQSSATQGSCFSEGGIDKVGQVEFLHIGAAAAVKNWFAVQLEEVTAVQLVQLKSSVATSITATNAALSTKVWTSSETVTIAGDSCAAGDAIRDALHRQQRLTGNASFSECRPLHSDREENGTRSSRYWQCSGMVRTVILEKTGPLVLTDFRLVPPLPLMDANMISQTDAALHCTTSLFTRTAAIDDYITHLIVKCPNSDYRKLSISGSQRTDFSCCDLPPGAESFVQISLFSETGFEIFPFLHTVRTQLPPPKKVQTMWTPDDCAIIEWHQDANELATAAHLMVLHRNCTSLSATQLRCCNMAKTAKKLRVAAKKTRFRSSEAAEVAVGPVPADVTAYVSATAHPTKVSDETTSASRVTSPPPKKPHISIINYTCVTVSWEAPASRETSFFITCPAAAEMETKETSHTCCSLTPGMQQFVAIRAHKIGLPPSHFVNLSSIIAVPAPTSGSVQQLSDTCFTATWQPVALSNVSYKVTCFDQPSHQFTIVNSHAQCCKMSNISSSSSSITVRTQMPNGAVSEPLQLVLMDALAVNNSVDVKFLLFVLAVSVVAIAFICKLC